MGGEVGYVDVDEMDGHRENRYLCGRKTITHLFICPKKVLYVVQMLLHSTHSLPQMMNILLCVIEVLLEVCKVMTTFIPQENNLIL